MKATPFGHTAAWVLLRNSSTQLQYCLQSIDSLQGPKPVTAHDHMRLRGGAPSGRRKADTSQQQTPKRKQSAQGTTSPSNPQVEAALGLDQTDKGQQQTASRQPSAGPSHQYRTGGIVEVIATHMSP